MRREACFFLIKQLVDNSKKIGGSAAGQTKRIEKKTEACLFSLSTQLTTTTVLQFNTFFHLFVFPALSAQTKDPIFFSFSFQSSQKKKITTKNRGCTLKQKRGNRVHDTSKIINIFFVNTQRYMVKEVCTSYTALCFQESFCFVFEGDLLAEGLRFIL